jgi:hypothetical protein
MSQNHISTVLDKNLSRLEEKELQAGATHETILRGN